ncbi:MAG TPA: adenylate/guanylate cyclase domain-containing protein [Acidimicrobiia bacterium]|nr:adenylate/guanylate cyclase domain-containing protein [Acidimicrobiia bacterium]
MSIDARVLVVDDDPLNRELLAQALKNEGCEVTTAEDGVRALRVLRADSRAFDLVLLDVMMPDMDGFDVLRMLKGDADLAQIPVVMISAVDDVTSIAKCLELGAEDYLSKPFDPTLLRARINNSLARKRHADTERQYLRLLEREETRSEQLILNILPRDIARRLKEGDVDIADQHDDVSVLFADIVGFTRLCAQRPVAEVVRLLNDMFCKFDGLAAAHGLEKIHTIGDCYFAVGGLSAAQGNHVSATIEMAFDMLSTVEDLDVEMRVGVHVGPVIAGVIGRHKFAYDIWGDTVNVASRMESHGLPGCVQVTAAVRDAVADRYDFEDRGTIEVKNRGPMQTYLVSRRASAVPSPMTTTGPMQTWVDPNELVRGL